MVLHQDIHDFAIITYSTGQCSEILSGLSSCTLGVIVRLCGNDFVEDIFEATCLKLIDPLLFLGVICQLLLKDLYPLLKCSCRRRKRVGPAQVSRMPRIDCTSHSQ